MRNTRKESSRDKEPAPDKEPALNYGQAYSRLKEIVGKMETEEVNVDEISLYLKEAVGLLSICKEKLYSTEKEVEGIIKKIQQE